jgi:hypothetical protein
MIVSFKDDFGREFSIECAAILWTEPAQVGYTQVVMARAPGNKLGPIVGLTQDKLFSIIETAHAQASQHQRNAQASSLLVPMPAGRQ